MWCRLSRSFQDQRHVVDSTAHLEIHKNLQQAPQPLQKSWPAEQVELLAAREKNWETHETVRDTRLVDAKFIDPHNGLALMIFHAARGVASMAY